MSSRGHLLERCSTKRSAGKALLAGFAAFTLSREVFAGDAALAEQLFADGKRLVQAGSFREGCIKFEESQRLDPAIGTEFHLADCHERIGKTATAWAEFMEVASLAHNSGQTAREEAARARAKALEPRIHRLTIKAQASTPPMEILRDGVPIGRAQWNTPMPVDPGEHRIVARSPGKIAWETNVPISVEGGSIAIQVPPLRDAPPPLLPPRLRPLPSEQTDTSSDRGDTQRIVGLSTAGAGLVGLGIATAFGIASKNHRDDAEAHCSGNLCDQTGVDERKSAVGAGDAATVAFALGGAALVTGTVLYFTAPHAPRYAETRGTSFIRTTPTVGWNGAGFALRGTFH